MGKPSVHGEHRDPRRHTDCSKCWRKRKRDLRRTGPLVVRRAIGKGKRGRAIEYQGAM